LRFLTLLAGAGGGVGFGGSGDGDGVKGGSSTGTSFDNTLFFLFADGLGLNFGWLGLAGFLRDFESI
jgi:hypothetical protein